MKNKKETEKYILKTDGKELKYGDMLDLDFTKLLEDGTVCHKHVEGRFTPLMVPILLKEGLIEVMSEEDEPCEEKSEEGKSVGTDTISDIMDAFLKGQKDEEECEDEEEDEDENPEEKEEEEEETEVSDEDLKNFMNLSSSCFAEIHHILSLLNEEQKLQNENIVELKAQIKQLKRELHRQADPFKAFQWVL